MNKKGLKDKNLKRINRQSLMLNNQELNALETYCRKYRVKNMQVFKELPRVFRHYYEISFKPAPGEGKHTIRLNFNNQVGDFLYTETEYFVGDKWELDELE